MKLDILITDASGCVNSTEEICITRVLPDTGNPSVGQTVFVPDGCTPEGGTVTVYLFDANSCTVNMRIYYTIGTGSEQNILVKADNVTDSQECPIYPPGMEP